MYTYVQMHSKRSEKVYRVSSIALRHSPLLNLELNGFFWGGRGIVLGYITLAPTLWLELHMATPGFLYRCLGFTRVLMLTVNALTHELYQKGNAKTPPVLLVSVPIVLT